MLYIVTKASNSFLTQFELFDKFFFVLCFSLNVTFLKSEILYLFFVFSYLQDTINFLMGILKRERDRGSQAFLAVGFLAIAVQGEILTYMSRIMDIIRNSLPTRDHVAK